MGVVSFTSLDPSFKLKNKKRISDWIKQVILVHHRYPISLTFVFCDDNYLLELNKKYLKHRTLTDIITFNYNEHLNVSGDIFISINRVRENALKFETTFENELHRVMVHGVLHLLGFDDKSDSPKKKMKKEENKFLALLHL